MARYRKIDPRIWMDEQFRHLTVKTQLAILKDIVYDRHKGRFLVYAGPSFRIASQNGGKEWQ